jgi:hypothetical protein
MLVLLQEVTMKALLRLVSLIFVFVLVLSAVGPAAADNNWAVGNLVGLCAGTHIYHGPGGSFPYHTIVPEDDWTVKVIDGPRYFDDEAWWDTSRFAAGDPSGGTGWVKQSEADSCFSEGGGGSTGGGADGVLDYPSVDDKVEPPYAAHFSWPLNVSPDDSRYLKGYFNFGSAITYACGDAVQSGNYYYLKDEEVIAANRLVHPGRDMALDGKTGEVIEFQDLPEVYAVADGKVVAVGSDSDGYGEHIIIYHRYLEGGKEMRIWSAYAHLHKDSIRVKVGQIIKGGDWIARYDHTGNYGGVAHLHFELRKQFAPGYCVTSSDIDKNYYNPETFISQHTDVPESITALAEQSATSSGTTTLAQTQTATIDQGQTVGPFQFVVNTVNWVRSIIALFWPGSILEITVYRPDGSIYMVYQSANSFTLEIPDLEPGTWSYTIRAVEVPIDDYPFAVAVALSEQQLQDTGERETGATQTSESFDSVPPTTIASLLPASPDGNNGWYKQPVLVTLTATDNIDDQFDTLYSLNGGVSYLLYSAPFLVDTEGENSIAYFSVDGMGNSEDFQSVALKIDMTPPVVVVDADQEQYTRLQPFVVHYSSYDPEPGSGLAALTGMFNGQSVANGQSVDMFWWDLGQYTLTVTGEDYAGWVTTESTSIQLVATLESLSQTVQRLCQEGYITKAGICKSLLSKLNAALAAQRRGQNHTAVNILLAFQHEVQAQADKSIRSEARALLMMDSDYVIESLGGR